MAEIVHSKKALAVNPLKVSQPIGASLAFLGLNRCLPLMHGSQGCTAFGKVFRAPFSRADPVANDGHGSGVEHHGRRRQRD
jgi:nitrogenase molybdenum-iron protein alpha/beta subunit